MLRFLFLNEVPGEYGGDGGGGTPPEDLTGLKNTIKALRAELTQATNKLKTFGDLDPVAAQGAIAEVSQLKATNETLTNQLYGLQLDTAAANLVTGVLPEFRELLLTNARQTLKVEGGNVVAADGRSLDELGQQYRSKYPQMFVPATPTATGTGAQNGSTPPPTSGITTVKASDLAAIATLDPKDVASGKVIIE